MMKQPWDPKELDIVAVCVVDWVAKVLSHRLPQQKYSKICWLEENMDLYAYIYLHHWWS